MAMNMHPYDAPRSSIKHRELYQQRFENLQRRVMVYIVLITVGAIAQFFISF